MGKLGKDLCYFFHQKAYVVLVTLAAVFSYAFTVSHVAVGIDDTAVLLYFEEGLAPGVGRWCLYLINKILKIGRYSPWLTEAAGVILLIISVTAWSALFYQIIGERASIWGYAFFAALFVSCPIISEVFVFYLHNGVCVAYGVIAVSLFCGMQTLRRRISGRGRLAYGLWAGTLLAIALGFYESFVMVYVIGMLLLYFLLRVDRENAQKVYFVNPCRWAVLLAGTGIFAIAGRTLMQNLICSMCHIVIPDNFISVEYRSIFGNDWQSMTDLFMVIKKFFVMYYLNAFCYLPITVFVFGIFILLIFGSVMAVRRKDIFIVLTAAAVPAAPLVMPLIEGYPTHYRASQYVPLVGAFSVLLLFKLGSQTREKLPAHAAGWISGLGILCAGILLWNQCADMNRWFYADYMKYEDAKRVMSNISYDLKSGGYDTSKPIVFRGAYWVPYGIARDAYLDFDSRRYQAMKKIADMIDVHLIEKFNAGNRSAYVFAETPVNSTLRWGVTAFDGTAGELEKFWRLHGEEDLCVERDLDRIAEAERRKKEAGMPGYPVRGYILECEEYIIVNLDNN